MRKCVRKHVRATILYFFAVTLCARCASVDRGDSDYRKSLVDRERLADDLATLPDDAPIGVRNTAAAALSGGNRAVELAKERSRVAGDRRE